MKLFITYALLLLVCKYLNGQSFSVDGAAIYSSILCSNKYVYSAGDNTYGEIGDNTNTQRTSFTQVVGVGGVGYLKAKLLCTASGRHELCLNTGDTVISWGGNAQGQLGRGGLVDQKTPDYVAGIGGIGVLSGIKEISGGDLHSAAIRSSDGAVLTWGHNEYGQLGNISVSTGAGQRSLNPVIVGASDLTNSTTSFNGMTKVRCGDNFTIALKSDGTVWAWGANTFGMCGDGTLTNRNSPVQVQAWNGTANVNLSNVIDISAGDVFCYALKNDSSVWAWGANWRGVIGQNNTNCGVFADPPCNNSQFYINAIQVKNVAGTGYLTGVKKIACGNEHGLILLGNGKVLGLGRNEEGQLGIGNTTNGSLPQYVRNAANSADITNIGEISCGDNWSFVLSRDGTIVHSWGANDVGQLGIGNTDTPKNLPQNINLPCSTISLPVKLLLFTAKVAQNERIILNWQTASEINNDFFNVERSNDGIHFEVIEKVKGSGYSAKIRNYAYTDLNPIQGVSYYRLCQVDYDGKIYLSEVVDIAFESTRVLTIKIYPNLLLENGALNFNSEREGICLISIFNIGGKEVCAFTTTCLRGENKIDLNFSDYEAGMYFITVTNSSKHSFKIKFIKSN